MNRHSRIAVKLMLPPRNWNKPEELAARWRVSADTVIRELKSGKLVGMRIGRQWRVSDEAVEQYESRGGMVTNDQDWGDVPDHMGVR